MTQLARAALCLFAVLVNAGQAAAATTYYFSSLHGNDKNSGTSEKAPWRSLARAALIRLQPKDVVLLERGSVFVDETLQVLLPTQGVVGAYGGRAGVTPHPIIERKTLPGRVECIQVVDPQEVTVQGLEMQGCTTGIHAVYSEESRFHGLSIQGCVFRDIRAPADDYNPAEANWGSAVRLTGGSTTTVSSTAVKNNIGLRIDALFKSEVYTDGLELNSNTVERCGFNCVSLELGANMHVRNSVFLRDTPPRLFLYGTTDVLVGAIKGDNSVENCDFNSRGEYEGGPDGCAVDLEAGTVGFRVSGNTFHRSWGSGVMLLGQGANPQKVTVEQNDFVYAGCVQPLNDRGGVAVMCPTGRKALPSAVVRRNRFLTCAGAAAVHINQRVQGCGSNIKQAENMIDGGMKAVEEPQIQLKAPKAAKSLPTMRVTALASSATPGAIIRYTLDGSRPSEHSQKMPDSGVGIDFPGPTVALNVKAFPPKAKGKGRGHHYVTSVTNGVILEGSHYKARSNEWGRLPSHFDAVQFSPSGVQVQGWAVDTSTQHSGAGAVTVAVTVDGAMVASTLASAPRPDLVKAHAAPNAEHGFAVDLPPETVALLQQGHHVIDAWLTGSPLSEAPERLRGSPRCTCDGAPCSCQA